MVIEKTTRRERRRSGKKFLSPGLILTIDEMLYAVQGLACDAAVARKAFRLTKLDGTLYDVAETVHGPECDCPDYIFRRDGLDPQGCKHIRALVKLGLIAGR